MSCYPGSDRLQEVMDSKMIKCKWEQEYKQKTWLELNQTNMRREHEERKKKTCYYQSKRPKNEWCFRVADKPCNKSVTEVVTDTNSQRERDGYGYWYNVWRVNIADLGDDETRRFLKSDSSLFLSFKRREKEGENVSSKGLPLMSWKEKVSKTWRDQYTRRGNRRSPKAGVVL